ncbi:MAG: S8 family serine peptidase [Pyrinomonadaceae bacterium]
MCFISRKSDVAGSKPRTRTASVVKSLIFFCLVLIFSSQAIRAENYAKGELLVKFRNGTASADAFSTHLTLGARVLEEFPELKWQRVKLPAGLSVEEGVRQYARFAGVEDVQPNYYYHLAVTPDDTRFSEMYGMQKISAPAAWDLTTGSSNVVVAVIDTGIKYTHEDLAANMWHNEGEIQGNGIDDDGNGFVDDFYGYDFFFNDSDPLDEHGHGTHVAGTIGAVGNNALGVTGVNWNVRLMAIKIYDSTGFGTTSAMLINAYNYLRMMRQRGVNIRVTNNSYSGCDEACGYDQATKDAIDALGAADVLQVFAAGNNGRNVDTMPAYPGSYNSPSILTVASSTSTDARSGFSNFGTANVDVAAPGSGILSTIMSGANYGTLSGTSMASPHVAGSAALLYSMNPDLSAASLKATLMNTVDQLSQWNGVVKTGGRINIANALQNQTVCDIALDRTFQHVFPEGGSFSINVTAPANCDYSIAKDAAAFFVIITSADTGSGNSTVTFNVENNSGLPRSGTIKIGDKNFMVNQNPGKIFPHRGYLDFNGDGRTDFVAIQDVAGGMLWHNYLSLMGYSPVSFGLFNDDIPVPGHYDSDLQNDIAVWRNSTGTFYILRSIDSTVQIVQFGMPGDNPAVTQDFDGDGLADFAVTRQEGGKLVWYVAQTTGGFRIEQFGNATDKALRGDYDGDGRADLAVYRPETDSPANTFFVLKSSDGGLLATQFGISATDRIVPADYDGDGKTDFAVWRETDGVWHYLKSSDGSYQAFQFGSPGDLPTPGDYDGDGRTDFSVWRPEAGPNEPGVFYVYSVLSGFQSFGWGNSTMKLPANSIGSQ